LLARVDGDETHASPLAPHLVAAGFSAGTRGYLKRIPAHLAGLRLGAGQARRALPRGPLGPDLPRNGDAQPPEPDEAELQLDDELAEPEGRL